MQFVNLAPAIFVFLWSTGWVTAKFAVEDSGPLTFLTLRFILSALALWAICKYYKIKGPSRPMDVAHALICGIFLHGIYLGMIWWAIGEGVPASIGGIIAGLQPLLTGCAAYFLLKERLSRVQMAGLIIGFIGIFIAVLPKAMAMDAAGVQIPLYAVAINMLGMVAVTLGTIYQKRFGQSSNVMVFAMLQYVGASLVVLPFAVAMEGFHFSLTVNFMLTMLWAVLAISIGAVALLLMLINRGQVSKAASLIYLVPPLAAVEAAVLFSEDLTTLMIIGTIVAVLGVYLANRRKH